MAERRLVKVELDADVEKYIRDMDRAAAATSRLAASGGGGDATATRQTTQANRELAQAQKQAQSSTAALSGEQRKAAESSIRLSQAENRVTDATERHAKAAKDLAAAQKTGNDDKIAAAKARHAKATRDLDIASRSFTVTESKVAEVLDQTGDALVRNERVSRQTSLTFGQIALAAGAIGPGLIPIAAAAGAAALGLGGMGAAGILAFVGIKREMEENTALGQRFSTGIETAKGALETLSTTAARGVLNGFEQSVGDLSSRLPTLNQLTAQLSASLGGAAASAFRGLLNLMTQAGPLMTETAQGAERLAQKFESWSSSDGARQLLEYMRSSLPGVGEMLGELGRAVVHLLEAMAPMGGQTVAAINALASAINAIPIGVLQALIPLAVQGGLAFKAWKGAAAGVAAVNSLLGRTGAQAKAAGGGLAVFGKSANTAGRGVNTFAGSVGKAERGGRRLSTGAKAGLLGLTALGVSALNTGDSIENFGLSQQAVTDRMATAKSGALDLGKGFFDLQLAMQPDASVSFAEGLDLVSGSGDRVRGNMANVATGLLSIVGAGNGAGSAMKGVETQFRAYGQQLGDMVRSGNGDQAKRIFSQMATEAKKQGISVGRLKELMPGYTNAIKANSAAQQQASAFAATYQGQLAAYGRGIEQLGGVNQRFGGSVLAARSATTGFYGALQQANAAVKENGRNLNLNTQAGLANRAALDNMAGASVKYAQEQFKATGSMGRANAVINQSRDSFVRLATSMGMPRAEAVKLANSMIKIPGQVNTDVRLKGAVDAYHDIDSLGRAVYKLRGHPGVSIPTTAPNAHGVIKALDGIDAKAVSANGKRVTITTEAPLAPATIAKIEKLQGVTVSANGKRVTVDTSAPNAPKTVKQLNDMITKAQAANRTKANVKTTTNAARTGTLLESAATRARDLARQKPNVKSSTNAQGTGKLLRNAASDARSLGRQRPNVPTTTNAPGTGSKLQRATGQARTLGRQRPNVPTSTNASSTRSKLADASSAASSLGSKRPNVHTSTNAPSVRGQIVSALRAAVNKSHTITTIRRVVGSVSGAGPLGGLFNAQGGPAYPGAPHFNTGGTLGRDFRTGGRVTGAGSRTSDSVPARLTFGPANLSNYEHVWTGNEVARSGGHGTMYAARALARDGRLQDVLAAGVRQGFATGGPAGFVHRKGIPSDLAGMRAWRPPARQTITVNATGGDDLAARMAGMESAIGRLERTLPDAVRRGAAAGTATGVQGITRTADAASRRT